MNYYAFFPTLTSILFLLMGVFIFLKNRKQLINKAYLYFCISIFIWLLPFSLMYWSTDIKLAYTFARIGFIGVLIIPICMFYFVVAFLDEVEKYKKVILILLYFTIPCIIINFCTPVFYSGIKICFWGFYPIAGKLYFIILSQFLILFCYAVWLLYKNINNPNFSAIKRQQTKYLMTAFFIITFGCIDYITKYPIEFYPFGYILILVFIFIMAVSIIKYNLMDIKLMITKTAIWGLLYLFILVLPIYFGFKTEKWVLSCFILLVLSTCGQIIGRHIQKKAELLLLAEQEKYQQLLMQASKGMIEKEYDILKLSQLIVRILKRSVKVNFVSLFLFNEDKNLYTNVSYRGLNKSFFDKINISKDDDIIDFMKKSKKTLFFNTLPQKLKNKFKNIKQEISLIIPSIFREEVIGFLIMGEKDNKTVYSEKDLEVFDVLSNQSALALENCKFLEKSQKQQKRLFEAEKLASIGGMADGMAHQIRNRLNVFNCAAEMINCDIEDFNIEYKDFVNREKKVGDILENINKSVSTIKSNIEKTNIILKGILDFAKPKGSTTDKEIFSFKDIVEASITLVQVKHHKEKIPVVMNIPENSNVYGIKYQIQEIVFNCIDNAFEAILEKDNHIVNHLFNDIDRTEKFVPEVKISLKYLDNNKYQIIISDNGIGIKQEDKSKIFSAFFTTKPSSKSGSGIGSYVAKRMVVEAHKGEISFESKYGIGTTFTITLPMSQKQEKILISNDLLNLYTKKDKI